MTSNTTRLLSISVGLLAATGLRAQFTEGFDNQASANVTIVQEPDVTLQFVDYSNMTVGATNWSIPESPRQLPGSASTSGVLIQCNTTAGAATGVNIIAGAVPLSFSGRYRMSFDAWINVPIPLPAGGTEQLLWGVGTDNVAPIEARNNRGSGTSGIWGWLAGENGYGTEDAAINDGDLELADLGDQVTGESGPFNEAFDSNALGGVNGAPANTWVRVDIEVDATGTRVFYNGVEFFNEPAIPQAGFAVIGYEDPFSSISGSPDGQWCLLDNFRVTTPLLCGVPGTATPQGTAMAGELLNGSAPPTVGCPMTLRLRGGPANSPLVFLFAGTPAPVTIPIPLGAGCTIPGELITLDATINTPTNADGGSQFSLEVPNTFAFCGLILGWQQMWLDPANPACPFVVTNGLTTFIGS